MVTPLQVEVQTALPSRSTVAGSTLGGVGLAPLIVWLLKQFGIDIPGEIAAIVGGLIANAVGYFFEGGRAYKVVQGGFARVGMLILLTILSAALLAGCVTRPDGGSELSATGRVALQEVTAIAVRRAISESPRAREKVRNIRSIAAQLLDVTSLTTVTQLRAAVEERVNALNLNQVDRADAQSLLNIFEALLREQIGEDIQPDAVVRVNEFVAYILAALPAV